MIIYTMISPLQISLSGHLGDLCWKRIWKVKENALLDFNGMLTCGT